MIQKFKKIPNTITQNKILINKLYKQIKTTINKTTKPFTKCQKQIIERTVKHY